MSKQSFQVGHVVELASDGPPMAVESVDKKGEVSCVWFDGKKYCRIKFKSAILKKCRKKSRAAIPKGPEKNQDEIRRQLLSSEKGRELLAPLSELELFDEDHTGGK
jgi:uncharacterized protein YodC (DUF2158 family)